MLRPTESAQRNRCFVGNAVFGDFELQPQGHISYKRFSCSIYNRISKCIVPMYIFKIRVFNQSIHPKNVGGAFRMDVLISL